MGFVVFTLFATVVTLGTAGDARAFTRSDEEKFKVDFKEAKARARDFKRHQDRVAKATAERERAVMEIKRKRDRDYSQYEQTRVQYLKVRPDYDKETAKLERLEAEFDRKKLAEDEQMDRKRQEYKRKRERLEKLIESEAFIDPADEYELKPF